MTNEKRGKSEDTVAQAREYIRNSMPAETFANAYPDSAMLDQEAERMAAFHEHLLASEAQSNEIAADYESCMKQMDRWGIPRQDEAKAEMSMFGRCLLLLNKAKSLASEPKTPLGEFPICPSCGKRVTISWEAHEDECEPKTPGDADREIAREVEALLTKRGFCLWNDFDVDVMAILRRLRLASVFCEAHGPEDCTTCPCCEAVHQDDLRKEAEARLAEERQPLSDSVLNQIVLDVAELPDRTSPEDWPEAMLVTAEELKTIIRERLVAEERQAGPRERALWVLRRIIEDLPSSRNWLDPAIEREARELCGPEATGQAPLKEIRPGVYEGIHAPMHVDSERVSEIINRGQAGRTEGPCQWADECSEKGIELLATMENADFEEAAAAIYDLRQRCRNLASYINFELEDSHQHCAEIARNYGRTHGTEWPEELLTKIGASIADAIKPSPEPTGHDNNFTKENENVQQTTNRSRTRTSPDVV